MPEVEWSYNENYVGIACAPGNYRKNLNKQKHLRPDWMSEGRWYEFADKLANLLNKVEPLCSTS